jgi:hypothetical protein
MNLDRSEARPRLASQGRGPRPRPSGGRDMARTLTSLLWIVLTTELDGYTGGAREVLPPLARPLSKQRDWRNPMRSGVPQCARRAENPDEIAGVLAHEFGHLRHRDATRNLIYNGGTSFLIGLLFGDITGSGALIFASRSLVTSSYSREAEQNADSFSIDTMHRLGRSPKAMGELMLRVTGKEEDKSLSEDRLARMKSEERPLTGPPLLTADEWASLKAICN